MKSKYTYNLHTEMVYGTSEKGLVIIPDQICVALKAKEHRWGTSFPALRVKHPGGHVDPRAGQKVQVRITAPDGSSSNMTCFIAIGA